MFVRSDCTGFACIDDCAHSQTDDSSRRAAAAAALNDPPALLSAPLTFKEQTSATDSKLMDLLWGKDKVRSARNETFDKAKSIASKRVERKQRQLIEADESSDEEEEQVSMMVLPDYSSGSGEKDINVLGFCIRSVSAWHSRGEAG